MSACVPSSSTGLWRCTSSSRQGRVHTQPCLTTLSDPPPIPRTPHFTCLQLMSMSVAANAITLSPEPSLLSCMPPHTSQLMPETLNLTVNLIDRFLEAKSVTRKNLQLVRACVCLHAHAEACMKRQATISDVATGCITSARRGCTYIYPQHITAHSMWPLSALSPNIGLQRLLMPALCRWV